MAGTTANSILVGLTSTDVVNNLPDEFIEMIKNEFIPRQDIPRYGEAEEVADAVSMLCGKESRWITGQTISVNGGICKLY
jgi:3-oxoacyl-[acyl-carrier protein] reductase